MLHSLMNCYEARTAFTRAIVTVFGRDLEANALLAQWAKIYTKRDNGLQLAAGYR